MPSFPNLYTLPPLPPSPVSNPASVVEYSPPQTYSRIPSPFLDAYSPHTETPHPIDETLPAHIPIDKTLPAHIPDVQSPHPLIVPESPQTLTDDLTQRLSLLSIDANQQHDMSDANQSSQAQMAEERAINSIVSRMNNLGEMTKTFNHLAKDGSNLVQWQDDIKRTIYLVTGVRRFLETTKPTFATRLDDEKNTAAMIIIETTIHESLRPVLRKEDYALDAVKAIKQHFQKGGRTAQFALFQRLVSLRFDPHESDVLSHTTKINSILSELNSTGFKLSNDSFAGFLYQLHMPPEMTKEVDRELDAVFKSKSGEFTAVEIRDALQMHVAREKITSETVSISNLQTAMHDLSVNAVLTPNQKARPRMNTPFFTARSSMTAPRTQNFTRFTNTTPTRIKGWTPGPPAISANAIERNASKDNPIPIPNSAINNVKMGIPECFYCGGWNHSYEVCNDYKNETGRKGAHYFDWRKTTTNWYSLKSLYPPNGVKPDHLRPTARNQRNVNIKSIEVSESEPNVVHASALDWSAEGVRFPDGGSDGTTEYLFDGGATDAVKFD